ncbi:MAG: (d)CMP kinase [Actinobacteria bacterium]|nr:(d)CMP kinase [Actinomycetota bacterium]
MIIAIDGPAGSGKSTVAREVAKRLRLRYLDTGAMYRTIALLALEAGLVPDRIPEAEAIAAKARIKLEPQENDLTRVFVDDREVSTEIRGGLVSQNVSAVSADPGVRRVLTALQRAQADQGDLVLEGRDMGTVVVPGADLKVYLTASVAERARRRQLQLAEKGITQPLDELIAEITRRDAYDSGRELAPLCRAEDAIEIDTTSLTIQEVIDAVCAEALRRAPQVARDDHAPESVISLKRRRWPLSRMARSPLDTLLYRVAYSFIPPVWKFLFRMKIYGAENIPPAGAVVLASNHRSNLDPFFLGVACPRQIHFMAKAELWKVATLGRIITAMGAFPIARGAADREAVRRAIAVLDQGAMLGLFPEGHRHRDGTLGPISPGVTLFSLKDGVTTVPAVLEGTERVIRDRLPRLPSVRVSFGAPLEMPNSDLPRATRAEIVGMRLEEALRHATSQQGDR